MGKNVQEQSGFTDDDLEGLGPDELAALNGGEDDQGDDDLDDDHDDDAADTGKNKSKAGDDADDKDEPDDKTPDGKSKDKPADKDDKSKGDKKPDDKKAGKDGDEDEDGEEDDADDDTYTPPAPKAPRYQVDDAAATKAKADLKTIESEFDALGEKFGNGDVDEVEYHKQMRALNKREREAERVLEKAETYAELNQANHGNDLQSAQNRFFANKENALFNDDVLFPVLQAALDKVGRDPKYKAAVENEDFDTLLTEAGRLAREKIGAPAIKPAGKADKNTKAADEINKRRAARDKAGDVIDKTLAGKTQAAGDAEEYTGKFAHLSGKEGLDLEAALSVLSEEDQREWAERG